MKNEMGALLLWLGRKLDRNHDTIVTKMDAIQNLFETSAGATVSPADILEGKTAYNGTTLITGTMTDQGAREATLLAGGEYNIPRGYHDGTGRVRAADLASQTQGTATEGGILSGLKAWVAGKLVDGSMKDRRGTTVTTDAVTQDENYTYLSIPEEACYDANSKVRTLNGNLGNFEKLKAVYNSASGGKVGSGVYVANSAITVPSDVKRGLIVVSGYAYFVNGGVKNSAPTLTIAGTGLKNSKIITDGGDLLETEVYACELTPGGTIEATSTSNYSINAVQIALLYL